MQRHAWLLLLGLLTGCNGGGEETTVDRPNDPSYGSVGPKTSKPAQRISFLAMQYSKATLPYWQRVIADFEQANAGAKIDLQVVQWDQGQTKLRTMVGARTPPDLANIATTWLTEYAEANLLEPLDQRMAGEFKARFIPATLQGATFEKRTYGLPVAVSVRALYGNRKLLRKAGVTNMPATWDELRSAAKAAHRDGAYGFVIPCDSEEGHAYFAYFLWGAGGDFFDHDGKLTINTRASRRALQFLVDLTRKDKCTNPTPHTANRDRDAQEWFKQGKAALLITGSWYWKMLEAAKVEYDMTSIPTPDRAQAGQATMAVTDNLVLFQQCANKDLAWKFLDFIYQPARRQQFDEAEGMLPELNSVADEYRKHPKWKLFIDQIADGHFLPNHPRAQAIFLELVKAQQIAYLGEREVPRALTDCERRVNELLRKK